MASARPKKLATSPSIIGQLQLPDGVTLLKLREEKPSPIKFGPPITTFPLPQSIIQVAQQRQITHLYAYQEQAFQAILAGEDVVFSAGTGMGKTEAFLFPILAACMASKKKGL
jgi:ATP-dependent helicase YprA (DUF1998 family)